ncbi:hypothetical protein F2P81_022560 [Scophthalmus maximus]|uniref:Uncharacterized protein n=1 Tax=Scophthalmus maximus TaxID=52904 RepID=A0A6A4RZF6_SCOMX|nr:hypothetical protein F2P81_022560 [Scophthalmus maximus]
MQRAEIRCRFLKLSAFLEVMGLHIDAMGTTQTEAHKPNQTKPNQTTLGTRPGRLDTGGPGSWDVTCETEWTAGKPEPEAKTARSTDEGANNVRTQGHSNFNHNDSRSLAAQQECIAACPSNTMVYRWRALQTQTHCSH